MAQKRHTNDIISAYNDIETTCSASKQFDMEVLMALKGGRRDEHTTLQVFLLMEVAKFSREFYGLIGSRKMRH